MLVIVLLFCIIGLLVAGPLGLIAGLVIGIIIALFAAIFSGGTSNVSSQHLQKECPECAELVKSNANKCRFCSHEFPKATVSSSPILGKERKALMYVHKIKFSPRKNQFKYKNNWFNTFEEAAQTAIKESNKI